MTWEWHYPSLSSSDHPILQAGYSVIERYDMRVTLSIAVFLWSPNPSSQLQCYREVWHESDTIHRCLPAIIQSFQPARHSQPALSHSVILLGSSLHFFLTQVANMPIVLKEHQLGRTIFLNLKTILLCRLPRKLLLVSPDYTFTCPLNSTYNEMIILFV